MILLIETSKHLLIVHFNCTSKLDLSVSTATGGRVAWLPSTMTGFLARDTICAHSSTTKQTRRQVS